MSDLNHTKIELTKTGLTETIQAMVKNVDSFVDFLVQEKPEVFYFIKGEEPGAMVDPFVLIDIMNREMQARFEKFQESRASKNERNPSENN